MFRRWLLRNFRAVYRFDRRLRSRLTAGGALVASSLVTCAVLGVNTRLNMAGQIFALLLSLLLLAALGSVYFRPRLRVTRLLPPVATATQAVRYRLRIENHGHALQRGLSISDELREDLPTEEEFRQRRDPADRYRNRFDRAVGYPRWIWLVHQKRGADDPVAALPSLSPGESVEVELELLPRRRGYLHFQGCRIARPDSLGLINALKRIPLPGALLVLPKRYPVAPVKLAGSRLYHPGGVTLASATGDSEEFMALRDYRPGDPLRLIHWKSWARTGKPIVKETRPEYFARYALILDTFTTPDEEALFEEAVSVAASFIGALKTGEALLDLLFVGPQVYRFTAGHGLDSRVYLLKILALAQSAAAEHRFATLCQAVMQQAAQLSGCVLVLLAWDQERQRLVHSLQSYGIQTRVLVLSNSADSLDTGDYIALPIEKIAEKLSQLCELPLAS